LAVAWPTSGEDWFEKRSGKGDRRTWQSPDETEAFQANEPRKESRKDRWADTQRLLLNRLGSLNENPLPRKWAFPQRVGD